MKEEIDLLKKKCDRTEKLLEKSEFERESSSKYVESFREQVSQLHEKLALERKKNENIEKDEPEKEDRGLSILSYLQLMEFPDHSTLREFKPPRRRIAGLDNESKFTDGYRGWEAMQM